MTGRSSLVPMRWADLRRATPPALLALILLALDHPLRAAPLAIVAVIVLAPWPGRPIGRLAARIAVPVGRAVTIGVLAVAQVVIVYPVWLARRLLRLPTSAHGWTATPNDTPARPFVVETSSQPQRLHLISRSITLVLIVALANYALGDAWDRIDHHHATPAPVVQDEPVPILYHPTAAQIAHLAEVARSQKDLRLDSPALKGEPWAAEVLADEYSTPSTFYPYLNYRPLPFHSRYLNIDGWARRSYTPKVTGRAPIVWMFGGSTTWGVAQRDSHTIASGLARLGEQAGTPFIIRNFGQRAWVQWQGMLLLEQLLAGKERPDLIVFYEGVNDYFVQNDPATPSAEPSYVGLDELARKATGKPIGPTSSAEAPQPVTARQGWDALLRAYRRHSLIDKLFGSEPAGATTLTQAQAATLAVYRRGRQLIEDLAGRAHATPVFYWQPRRHDGEGYDAYYRQLGQLVGPPTIDATTLMDKHTNLFIDASHTNETGAAIIADGLWRTFGPRVARWYATHR